MWAVALVSAGCGGGGSIGTSGTAGGVGGVNPSGVTAPADGSSAPANPAPTAAESTPRMDMSAFSTRYTGDYGTVTSGAYTAINNNWNANSCEGQGQQRVGVSQPWRDGSVDVRIDWDYKCPSWRLLGFPEVVYGVPSTPSVPAAPGANLPKRLSDLRSVKTSYSGVEGSADGGGYLAYDVWISLSPDGSMDPSMREAEILIPLHPVNGFSVPQEPEAALVGRESQTQRIGWHPKGYRGRHVIGGNTWDVYYDPPGTHSYWKFLSLLPIDYPMKKGVSLDWQPILAFFIEQGWLSPTTYLSNVELGFEVYTYDNQAIGDLTVRKFKVDVQ
jgi:Glycosyl hydrolase family 12